VRAYKFLKSGGVGPFSRYAWPLPRNGRAGAWVISGGGTVLCHSGIHACRLADLPWWLQDELWEAELDGEVAAGRHKVTAPRARLVRRVDAWDAACARRFGDACALRAHDHAARAAAGIGEIGGVTPDAARIAGAMAGDATTRARSGAAIVAAYIAAHTAGRVDGPAAVAGERAWQAQWLAAELTLDS
jgi:hypothetical protein